MAGSCYFVAPSYCVWIINYDPILARVCCLEDQLRANARLAGALTAGNVSHKLLEQVDWLQQ